MIASCPLPQRRYGGSVHLTQRRAQSEEKLPPKCPLSEGSLAIILELSNSHLLQLSFKPDGSPAIILFWSCLLMKLSSRFNNSVILALCYIKVKRQYTYSLRLS